MSALPSVNEESRAHRAEPIAFAQRIAGQLLGHHFTRAETIEAWESQLSVGMWYADDALHALERLAEAPPSGLLAWLREATGGTFSAANQMDDASPSAERVATWLRDLVGELRQRFEAALDRFEPERVADEQVYWAADAEEAKTQAAAEVPFWATDVELAVESAVAEWGPGAWSVRTSYTLPYR